MGNRFEQTFHQNTQMTNKHMKIRLTFIREMQIETFEMPLHTH